MFARFAVRILGWDEHMRWKIPKIEMPCGYCGKKKIFTITEVDKKDGFVFCCVQCKNAFNRAASLAFDSYRFKKNKSKLTRKDKAIIRREKKIMLLEMDRMILQAELKKRQNVEGD